MTIEPQEMVAIRGPIGSLHSFLPDECRSTLEGHLRNCESGSRVVKVLVTVVEEENDGN